MKIAVFSDSHGSVGEMEESIRAHGPERVFHLGDHDGDVLPLKRAFPKIEFVCVAGNCDAFSRNTDSRRFVCEGKQIWMTHGHRQGVKTGLRPLLETAIAAGDDLVLFGHTHRAILTEHRGIQLVNPGSIGTGRARSFALIRIDFEGIDCRIMPYAGP